MDELPSHRGAVATAAGLVAGAFAAAVVLLAGTAGAVGTGASGAAPVVEATHLPPLLTLADERTELRYDIYCVPLGEDVASDVCDASGTVFARAGDAGPFQSYPLHLDPKASEGRYVTTLPDEVAHSDNGFSYYAVLSDTASGAATTLPSGGAKAPERSLPMERPIAVRLGAHRFGAVRRPDSRVVSVAWGDGAADAGLEQGRNLTPIGGAAFDVHGGSVWLLDEAHKRVLRWRENGGSPTQVPVDVNGTLADMSVAADGTIYVLESTASPGRAPLLRAFGPEGHLLSAGEVADPTTSDVRIGPEGPVVLEQGSDQWMDAARNRQVLSPTVQASSGHAGRRLLGGDEVTVLRRGNELRASLVAPNGTGRSWDITSATPLAEVQLAEPLGNALVVVARVYTDSADEFVALELGGKGVVRAFSLDSADWAETAPLSRFRLSGSSLYQLGSTATGLFIDRFDLGVK